MWVSAADVMAVSIMYDEHGMGVVVCALPVMAQFEDEPCVMSPAVVSHMRAGSTYIKVSRSVFPSGACACAVLVA